MTEPKWISVKERLPDLRGCPRTSLRRVSDRVRVRNDDVGHEADSCYIATPHKSLWHLASEWMEYWDVTHWMPITERADG